MEKTSKQLIAFMIAMLGFTYALIFGILFGEQYPLHFFMSLMAIFAMVIGVMVAPTTKDFFVLIGGMVVLAIVGSIANTVAAKFFAENFLAYLAITVIIISPAYFPVRKHFLRLLKHSRLSKEMTAE